MSKAAADLLIHSYVHTYGIDAVVTRSANNYGPWASTDKLIPRAITCLLRGRKVPIHGDGMMVRDWLFVDDHCRAIETVLWQGARGAVYNVGAHCERSVRDVVAIIAGSMGVAYKDVVEHQADRPGNDRRYGVSAEKIRALGWRPTRHLEEEIPRLVAWYENHRAWWEAAPSPTALAIAR